MTFKRFVLPGRLEREEEEAKDYWHGAANRGLCVSSVSCFITKGLWTVVGQLAASV